MTCMTDDANVATVCLQQVLKNLLDIWEPFTTIQLKHKFQPFLSIETKDLMKERDTKFSESRHNKENTTLWNEYKTLRNKVVTESRKDETNHNIKILKGDEKWKTAKKLMNINQTKTPSMIKVGSEIVTDSKEMCEHMNDFFIEKPKGIKNKI